MAEKAKTETKQEQAAAQAPSILTDDDKREITMAIKTKETGVMDPVAYEQMKVIARDMLASKSLPSTFTNAAQIQMALMAGREMGMTTMESLNDLYFVDGKLQIYGKATPAALRRAGWRIKFDDAEDACTATITNTKTGEEITDTFTLQDAELSGFVKDRYGNVKVGWKPGANRKRKLRYAVLSQIIHTYVPEVLGSVAGIGEYSDDYLEAEKLDKEFRAEETKEKQAEKLAKLQKLESEKEPQEAEIVQ